MGTINHGINLRLKVNKEQERLLNQNVGNARMIYNHMLNKQKLNYDENGRFFTYVELANMLPDMKKDPSYSFLKNSDATTLQCSVKDLSTAFKNFFESKNGSRKGEQMGFPKFKRRNKSRKSFRINNINSSIRVEKYSKPGSRWRIKLGKLGFFSVYNWQERLLLVNNVKKINNATIYKDSDSNWYVSLSVESESQANDITYENTLGIDLGLKDLAILSTGDKIDSLETIKKYEKKLAKLQRAQSRMVKFSNNWYKIGKRIGKVHFKIKMTRKNYLHQWSRVIVDHFDVITVETLQIKNIMKNHKLAKKTADQSWYKFKTFLRYKTEWAGKKLIEVSEWFPSSKTCSCCGTQVKLTLNIRSWKCPKCKSVHDRDINASKNLEKVSKYFVETSQIVTSKDDFLKLCFR